MKTIGLGAFALVSVLGSALSASASSPVITRFGASDAKDWRMGRVVDPIPYPANRTDDPRRVQNGRLWVPRSPVGTRTPINEQALGVPGAASYGAAPEEIDRAIRVQQRYNLPVEIISPWQAYNGNAFQGLREGQQQWLREQGYILRVRTHVNPATLRTDGTVHRSAADIKPHGVIRIRERLNEMPKVEADASRATE